MSVHGCGDVEMIGGSEEGIVSKWQAALMPKAVLVRAANDCYRDNVNIQSSGKVMLVDNRQVARLMLAVQLVAEVLYRMP